MMSLEARETLINIVTGIALIAYIKDRSFAILLARSLLSESCSNIMEFWAGGIDPSNKSVNATIA